MESLLEKITSQNMPFMAFYDSLTDKEKALVTKARRAGLLTIQTAPNGDTTVSKVVA